MKQSFDTLAAMLDHGFDTVVDVRSPSEFAEDHIPGAMNLPVLDDEERARVGTIYKQQSPFDARVVGAALVARNSARHLQGPLSGRPGGWRPLIYCWRGGQRSGSFATILAQVGWRVGLLDGGYKAYRRHVVNLLHDSPLAWRFIVLDGYTGTAKTEILERLDRRGFQVLDLEGLAAHRGSVFGQVNVPQPAQKLLETRIASRLAVMDPARPVLVEAESSKIGNLLVPPSLWDAMKAAPRLEISAPVEARADYLVRAYADIVEDVPRLVSVLESLIPLQGETVVGDWKGLAQSRQFRELAKSLVSVHYDGRYARSRASHPEPRATFRAESLDGPALDRLASEIAAYVVQLS